MVVQVFTEGAPRVVQSISCKVCCSICCHICSPICLAKIGKIYLYRDVMVIKLIKKNILPNSKERFLTVFSGYMIGRYVK